MMKKTNIDLDRLNEQIRLKKGIFREHQRTMPFDEKMKIAFSLAERDKAIRLAIPLNKTNKGSKR